MTTPNHSNRSLARRVAPAVALTGASILGIVLLDRAAGGTGANSLANGLGDSTVAPTVAPTTQATTPASPVPPAGRPGDDDGGFGPEGGDGGFGPGEPGGLTDTTAAPAPGCLGTTTTGTPAPISDRRRTYGTVTVSITKDRSGVICDVNATYNVRDRRSQRIEEFSIPRLNAWVKESNGTSVHAISGATAICEAYVTSLQAALDAAANS